MLQLLVSLDGPTASQKVARARIKHLKEELSKIKVTENFAGHMKIQRQICAEQAKADQTAEIKMNNFWKKLVLDYGIDALQGFVLVCFSFFYRSYPVIEFGDKFNFTPFTTVMMFPTGINGAISVPFWILINSIVAKNVISYFSSKGSTKTEDFISLITKSSF